MSRAGLDSRESAVPSPDGVCSRLPANQMRRCGIVARLRNINCNPCFSCSSLTEFHRRLSGFPESLGRQNQGKAPLWERLLSDPVVWRKATSQEVIRKEKKPDLAHSRTLERGSLGSYPHSLRTPRSAQSQDIVACGAFDSPNESPGRDRQKPGSLVCREVSTDLERLDKLCEEGKVDEAFQATYIMAHLGVYISRDRVYRLLKGCISKHDLKVGRSVHELAVEIGYELDRFLANHVIRMYASCGSLEEAHRAFMKVPAPDAFMWASIISVHGEHGHAVQAIELYHQMRKSDAKPNDYIFVAVLKACANLKDLASGKVIHADVVESGFESNVFVGNTLLDMYVKCECLAEARKVFDTLSTKDVITWSAMIEGYAKCGLGEEALNLYSIMQDEDGLVPDKVTFVSILKACASLGDIVEAKQVHSQICKAGLEFDVILGSSLVDMYAKCGSLEAARNLFDRLPTKDVVTWSAMIWGYAQHGLAQEALDLYASMPQDDSLVNQVTFLSALKACGSLGALQEGKHVHARVLERNLETDLLVGSALVDMYGKSGSLEDARTVFDRLPNRDLVTWCSIIAAYSQSGLGNEALKLYAALQQEGLWTVNNVTLACVLKACSSMRSIQEGRHIHSQILDLELEADVTIGNTLVDMYAKCGSLEDARRMFDKLLTKDRVTWNAMLSAYAQHGLGTESLLLYETMQQHHGTPNEGTFVSILKACGLTGAIQKGKHIHMQILERGLEADVLVGSALIDMYVKCGSLTDAVQVFMRLPTKNVVTWTALINGYGHHNDQKMAIDCFENMKQHGVEPDAATFTSLLVACSHLGLVNEGWRYFQMIGEDLGTSPTIEHYTCMVDLLGRSGHLDEAENLLQTMPFESCNVGWMSLLSASKSYADVDRGRRCFEQIVKVDPEQPAAYVLMSTIYSDAGRFEGAQDIERLRGKVGVLKKPAEALIEVQNTVQAFIVGQEREDTSAKLTELNTDTWERENLPYISGELSHEKQEDTLCAHAEKLALAFGLLNTAEGSTLLITKNLRMCGHCHTGTKLISRIEKREIIVRDAHRVHHFKDGLCFCGDHQ